MNKASLITSFLLFLFNATNSQDFGNTIDGLTICSKLGSNNFSDSKAANDALDEIVGAIGVAKTFVLQPCENVSNASALTVLGVRYIFYNPSWMNDLQYSGNWVNKFILAHEVGHHVNNHTIDVALLIGDMVQKNSSLSDSKYQELQADEFAGFVLGRLGATLDEALAAVKNLSNEDDTYSTHPKRDKRILAVKKGFENSGGKIAEIGNISEGKIVESPYSDKKYANIDYTSIANYNNIGLYEGYVSRTDKLPFGYGTVYWQNGDKYEGEWSGGRYNGYGIYTKSNKTTYEGFWVNDEFTGSGVIDLSTTNIGCKIIGAFVNKNLIGDGVLTFEDGKRFEGKFKDGVAVKGKLFNSNQELLGECGFENDFNGTGIGTYVNSSGSKFKGHFIDYRLKPMKGLGSSGDPWGNGKIHNGFYKTYDSKDLKRKKVAFVRTFIPTEYFPEYANELNVYPHSGLGSVEFGNNIGRKVWNLNTGQYAIIENLKDGYNTDRNYQKKYAEYISTFDWNIRPFGETLTYIVYESEDRVYKGYALVPDVYYNWLNPYAGLKESGYGELILNDGTVYKGMFWRGAKNGYGILTKSDGTVEKGLFKNDEFVRPMDFDFEYMQRTMKYNGI